VMVSDVSFLEERRLLTRVWTPEVVHEHKLGMSAFVKTVSPACAIGSGVLPRDESVFDLVHFEFLSNCNVWI
jgi:hypothetical protein